MRPRSAAGPRPRPRVRSRRPHVEHRRIDAPQRVEDDARIGGREGRCRRHRARLHPFRARRRDPRTSSTSPTNEDPPICKTFFARPCPTPTSRPMFGGPPTTDWNGHGILDRRQHRRGARRRGRQRHRAEGRLVALKISQWCGSAYDSTIIDAFLYAADHGIDVVNISFGGYLDRSDPDQDLALPAVRRRGEVRPAASARRSSPRRATSTCASAPEDGLSHGSLTCPAIALRPTFRPGQVPGGSPASSTSPHRQRGQRAVGACGAGPT